VIDQFEHLSGTVRAEVIPRLLKWHRATTPAASQPRVKPDAKWAQESSIHEFTDRCIDSSEDLLEQRVVALLDQDVSIENVYEHLLGPVARELGDRWLSDDISFVDVYMGVLHLQNIVLSMQRTLVTDNKASYSVSAILSATPGDQHTFGVQMAADLLARRGWEVVNLSGLDTQELASRVAVTDCNVVYLSLYVDAEFQALQSTIQRIRMATEDRDITVVVTGDYFMRNPDHWIASGADLFCKNTEETVQSVAARFEYGAQFGLCGAK